MATPTQVPEPPPGPVPPQPRPAYIWLMRGGCIAFIGILVAFAIHAPESAFLDAIAMVVFAILGVGKRTERWLKSTLDAAVLVFAVMLFALLLPYMSALQYERIETALLVLSNVALITVFVGALLAYRSVPKEVWAAQRPVAPQLDRAQLNLPFSMAARGAALVVIAIVAYAAVDTHEGFIFFAVLFAIPYLVFALLPTRPTWLAWGKALAWTVGIPFLIASGFAVAQFVTGGHVTRSGRYFTVFVLAVLATQVAQWLCMRRAYPPRLPIARAVGQSIVYFAIVLILLAVALPDFYGSRKASNESSAAASVRTINTVAITYQTQYQVGYPPSLKVLGACGANSEGTKDAACMLDQNLGCPAPACIKTGYRFMYKPVIKDGVVVHYSVVARPVEYEETGIRSFFSDDSAIIRATSDDRDANANDPPL